MSDVVLSAGVRQNLLALQSTADLMSLTQNRLATGKKVNSALDNPGNFFTSQSLNNRASDLNALLDSIGQAQKTIEAADQGITSLTKLVESAKSVAKQALQAPQPGSATYSSVALSRQPDGRKPGYDYGAGTSLHGRQRSDLFVRRSTRRAPAPSPSAYVGRVGDLDAEILAGLQSAFCDRPGNPRHRPRECDAHHQRRRHRSPASTRVNADFDFTIATSRLGRSHSEHLHLDQPVRQYRRGATGSTLTFAVNGGANQVVTFGTGLGEVSTLAELSARINSLGGLTATASNGAVNITLNSASSANSLTITSSHRGPDDGSGSRRGGR